MQFSALRYFLETARLGSIRRAAEGLYVAPSAVSRQIALLEQNFGAPLFERHAEFRQHYDSSRLRGRLSGSKDERAHTSVAKRLNLKCSMLHTLITHQHDPFLSA